MRLDALWKAVAIAQRRTLPYRERGTETQQQEGR